MRTKRFHRHLLIAVALATGIMMTMSAIPAMAQNQPNMQSALRSLYQARNHLNAAKDNKGGHRRNAINLVNRAINEVQSGMTYASQHPGQKNRQYRNEQQRRYEEQHRREQQKRYEEQHRREQQKRYEEQHHGPHATPTPHGHRTPYPSQYPQGPGH